MTRWTKQDIINRWHIPRSFSFGNENIQLFVSALLMPVFRQLKMLKYSPS